MIGGPRDRQLERTLHRREKRDKRIEPRSEAGALLHDELRQRIARARLDNMLVGNDQSFVHQKPGAGPFILNGGPGAVNRGKQVTARVDGHVVRVVGRFVPQHPSGTLLYEAIAADDQADAVTVSLGNVLREGQLLADLAYPIDLFLLFLYRVLIFLTRSGLQSELRAQSFRLGRRAVQCDKVIDDRENDDCAEEHDRRQRDRLGPSWNLRPETGGELLHKERSGEGMNSLACLDRRILAANQITAGEVGGQHLKEDAGAGLTVVKVDSVAVVQ